MENVEQKNVEIALMMGWKATGKYPNAYTHSDYAGVFLSAGMRYDTDWNWLMKSRDFLAEQGLYIEMINDSVKIIDHVNTKSHKITVFEYSCLRLNLFEAIYQYAQWRKQTLTNLSSSSQSS